MNIANKLTIFRIILVPVFILCFMFNFPYHGFVALLIFAVASITDMIDGKLARKYNLITEFGKLMDPLADKILVIAALIMLIEKDLIFGWIVLIIIARELLVTSMRLVAVNSGKVIAASIWGKMKTVTQLVGIVIILLEYSLMELKIDGLSFINNMYNMNIGVGQIILYIATILTVFSGYEYMKENWEFIDYKK